MPDLSVNDYLEVLAVVVPLAGLIVGLIGSYLRWRASPRKQLHYSFEDITDLRLSPGLKLSYGGKALNEPHTVVVKLSSAGTRSIRVDDFEQGEPIRFSGSARVVELLKDRSEPSEYKAPPGRVDENVLLVGPGSISKRQAAFYTVMLDGAPGLACEAPLPDVKILSEQEGLKRRKWANRLFSSTPYLIIFSIISLFFYWLWFSVVQPPVSPEDVDIIAGHETSKQSSWILQIPSEDLPQLPGRLNRDCPDELERAVTAGAGVPADYMLLHLETYTFGSGSVDFRGARLILDDKLPVIPGPRLKCTKTVASAHFPRESNQLLLNLDDQSIRYVPSEGSSESYSYELAVWAEAEACYCKWHLELDLQVGDVTVTFIIAANGSWRKEAQENRGRTALPFEISGSDKSRGYTYKGDTWKPDS